MSEIKLTKEQFDLLYEQLKVPAQINKDDIFECYDAAFDNAEVLLLA